MSKRFNPITGDVIPVFFHYAIPSVIGLLAATSAGLIDGIFIGNYVGASALAAINIALPAFFLFAAVVFMLAVGGSVMCGKFLGEGDQEAASAIFSKTMYASLVLSLSIVAVSLFFLDEFIILLGANEDLHHLVRDYMQIILWASPMWIIGLTLDYFVKVDGRPILASIALVTLAASNVALDWLFVAHWGWGLKGAAWATALANGIIMLILTSHWLSRHCSLKLVLVPLRWRDGWDSVFRAAYNGFSEFANELSLGLVTLLFNWVMITRLGVDGVAAFTIISYLLMVGLGINYGVCESMQPVVSKNLGARQTNRIVQFTRLAVISSFAIGLGVSALLVFLPETLISIFLREGERATENIALAFIAVFWPAFLFNGSNITLSSYFTAMHKPLQSTIIAVSRSLVFPALGLLLLPRFFGDLGIFLSIPIAEAITLIIALLLVAQKRTSSIVADLAK